MSLAARRAVFSLTPRYSGTRCTPKIRIISVRVIVIVRKRQSLFSTCGISREGAKDIANVFIQVEILRDLFIGGLRDPLFYSGTVENGRTHFCRENYRVAGDSCIFRQLGRWRLKRCERCALWGHICRVKGIQGALRVDTTFHWRCFFLSLFFVVAPSVVSRQIRSARILCIYSLVKLIARIIYHRH